MGRPKQPHGNTDTGIMDLNSPNFWRNAYSNDKITQPFVNTKRRDSYRHLDQMKVPQRSEHDLHQSLNETKLCSSGKWMLVQKAIFKKELRTSKPVKTVQLSDDLRSDQ